VFNYLIRVKLPDRPGALGAVASRIGSVGGDVVSIDILQRDHGVVVDELGVGLAGDNLIDLLRDEILEVDGVSIESVRPVEGPLPDRDTELLGVAAELFRHAPPDAILAHLVTGVRRGLTATFTAVVAGDGATGPDGWTIVECDGAAPDREALDLGRTVAPGSGERPDLARAPMDHAGMILLVGRAEPVLRRRERRWILTMAELADCGWRDRP
jgi:hypothetical protein